MFSVLYCLSIKRLKAEKSLEYYTELLLSLCCENNVNAKKVMKYLEKYESESGNLTCYIIEKGKSSYSNACRQRALRYYDKNENYKQYINLYNKLINNVSI